MHRGLVLAASVILLSACAPAPSGVPSSAASLPATAAAATSRPPAACATAIPDYWRTSISYAPGGKRLPPVAITLTCDHAVTAAWAALGSAIDVGTVEFGYGAYCGDSPCPAMPPNTGYVAFRFKDGRTVLVGVQSDSLGRVTTDMPVTLQPSPSLPSNGQGG